MKKENTLVILHFNSIELYPPVLNILDYLSENTFFKKVYVFTNSSKDIPTKYSAKNDHVIIKRVGVIDASSFFIKRYYNSFSFYFRSFLSLKKIKPAYIWYFETFSSLPVLWYSKHIASQKTKLLIHYHEYSPPEVYNSNFFLKWLTKKEKKLFPIAERISHTNEKRMELFEKNIGMKLPSKYILPNYPSKSWLVNGEVSKSESPLRAVYIGALNIITIFSKEFAVWVEKQNGNVVWDVYSQQDPSAFLQYLESINSKYCNFRGFVKYDELPEVLKNYHVGVILYKGHTDNYVHNAPNKLFEYLCAGLDVWFSKAMDGCMPYVTTSNFPKILPVDFEDLSHFDMKTALNRTGMQAKRFNYYADYVFRDFFNTLMLPNQVPASLPA